MAPVPTPEPAWLAPLRGVGAVAGILLASAERGEPLAPAVVRNLGEKLNEQFKELHRIWVEGETTP
jgi:hypothetical protein